MKPWNPITRERPNDRLEFLAWRYVDETETGIEMLAYNYSFGKAFYLVNADSLDVINPSKEAQ